MIGCWRTRVRKQPIIALYFEFENELKFYNLEACSLRSTDLHGRIQKVLSEGVQRWQRFFSWWDGEIEMPLKVGHHRAASKTSPLNAGLVALWFL